MDQRPKTPAPSGGGGDDQQRDPHLLKQFIAESEELIEGLHGDLDRLAEQHAGGRVNPDLINRIFRTAHSLKGMAGMAGLRAIQGVAHRFEDLLDDMRMGRFRPDPSAIGGFTSVAEGLRHLVAAVDRGQPHDAEAERLVAIVESLRSGPAAAAPEDPAALVDLDEQVRKTLTEYEEHRLVENLRERRAIYEVNVAFDLESFDTGFRGLSEALAATGEVISTLPGMGSGDVMQIAFRILFASDATEGEVATLAGTFGGAVKTLSHYDAPPAAGDTRRESEWLEQASTSLRVDMRGLEDLALLAQNLALKTAELNARNLELVARLGLPAREEFDLRQRARTLEREFVELEERLVDLRLVPLAQTFTRARRLVRQIAAELGRVVDFAIEGEDVRLDKAIVDRIAEPLAHLLHNAVDHGVEPPDAREAAGKPRAGSVRLRAEPDGSRILISVSDDGAGIDVEAVRRAAAERDAPIPEGVDPLRLIFEPGVSTAASVSSISGRGVGMDAVAAAVAELGGEVGVASEPGAGTTIWLTLPTTLVMISAFLVEVDGLPYAVDVNHLSELGLVDRGAIARAGDGASVVWRESPMPVVDLGRMLGSASRPGGQAAERLEGTGKVACLIARAGDRHAAVAVDRFVEEREVIVKSLGRYGARLRGVNGAIELEGGRIALLLDIPTLVAAEARP